MGAYRVSATAAVREFSELLRRVGDGGQEVIIERHRKPVARLSTAGFSPVRWIDFTRQVRRARQPDSNFFGDLAASRGEPPAALGSRTWASEMQGTLLLDSSLLLMAGWRGFTPALAQRVATTVPAIAELKALTLTRGDLIGRVRSAYIERVVRALPVLSLTAEAALSVHPDGGGAPRNAYFDMAQAVARSVGWPVYGVSGRLVSAIPGQ
ncbi:MAG: type II toxin-antitoxin system Phd/YefM family antitoxin [Candidatus Dormibacteria bacterium]